VAVAYVACHQVAQGRVTSANDRQRQIWLTDTSKGFEFFINKKKIVKAYAKIFCQTLLKPKVPLQRVFTKYNLYFSKGFWFFTLALHQKLIYKVEPNSPLEMTSSGFS